MPHGKVVIVLIAVFFVTTILRGFKRPRTAIVDHPVTAVRCAFRLTTLISTGFLLYTARRASASVLANPAIEAANAIVRSPAIPARGPIPGLLPRHSF